MTTKQALLITFLALCLANSQALTRQRRLADALHAYVPCGLSREEYQQIKAIDQEKGADGKKLGGLGPRKFKSRYLQFWQEAHERREARHIRTSVGYREALKAGQIKKQDIPFCVKTARQIGESKGVLD